MNAIRKLRPSLHAKVHTWMKIIGFRLNNTQTDKDNVTTYHYFFETFNFFEKEKNNDHSKAQFVCFDTYGERIHVRSLLDMQTAFFDNISQLK